MVASLLKSRDLAAAARVNRFVAISESGRGAIKKFYNRDSDVIFSPIDYDKFVTGASEESADHYLIVSRLEHWKRIDYAIDALLIINTPKSEMVLEKWSTTNKQNRV